MTPNRFLGGKPELPPLQKVRVKLHFCCKSANNLCFGNIQISQYFPGEFDFDDLLKLILMAFTLVNVSTYYYRPP